MVRNHSIPAAPISSPSEVRRRGPTFSDSWAENAASGIITSICGSRPTDAASGV